MYQLNANNFTMYRRTPEDGHVNVRNM